MTNVAMAAVVGMSALSADVVACVALKFSATLAPKGLSPHTRIIGVPWYKE